MDDIPNVFRLLGLDYYSLKKTKPSEGSELRTKVSLAIALLQPCPLLLLDEPFTLLSGV